MPVLGGGRRRRSGGWRWRGSPGDPLPAGDGVGVASPALNSRSIRDRRVSDSALLLGEPAGPWRAKSMIWWDSAMVPRLARTWSRGSPPREESVCRGAEQRAGRGRRCGSVGEERRQGKPVGRSIVYPAAARPDRRERRREPVEVELRCLPDATGRVPGREGLRRRGLHRRGLHRRGCAGHGRLLLRVAVSRVRAAARGRSR